MRLPRLVLPPNQFLKNDSQNKTANIYFTTESIFEDCFIKNETANTYLNTKPMFAYFFIKKRFPTLIFLLNPWFENVSQIEIANTNFTTKRWFEECFPK